MYSFLEAIIFYKYNEQNKWFFVTFLKVFCPPLRQLFTFFKLFLLLDKMTEQNMPATNIRNVFRGKKNFNNTLTL